MIVGKESSLLGYAEERSIPLDADHHDVCKFSSRDDASYRLVMSVVKTVASKYISSCE